MGMDGREIEILEAWTQDLHYIKVCDYIHLRFLEVNKGDAFHSN
jgi:hypothetical protein